METNNKTPLIAEGIAFAKKRALKKRLQQLESTLPEVEKPRVSGRLSGNLRRWVAVAAILMLFVAGWFLFQPKTNTSDTLFASHFEPYPTVGLVRSDKLPDLKARALIAYNSGNFHEAAELLEAVSKDSSFLLAPFYLGISLLGDNQPEKAAQVLEGFRKHSDTLKNQAAWYLALAYLKMNKPGKIKTLYETMPDCPEKTKIGNLLTELSNLEK